ncbi:hypothetical protein [uncultured Amphritea sp.]|uniref:hypothetical protein n=1 Tax=Amphritea sp. TaxID=1872502 RepID=UPI0025FCF4D0|nr:hypothetical protein [uncultured Amphritea sp.]
MSRSLYELCCRYSNGEIDTREYRRLRRRFIDNLVNSSDQTQPATDMSGEEFTRPHFSPAEAQSGVSINDHLKPPGATAHDQTGPVITLRSRATGKLIIQAVCLLLVAGGLLWVLNTRGNQDEQAGQGNSVTTAVTSVTSPPVLNHMHALLDLDKWSIADVDGCYALLLKSSAADKSVLRSDDRYHQFLDTVHIYQALAEADQNEVMIARLALLERALRD